MDLTALLLSRLQFAFTVSFHIIFPSFTIGLAAWLTVLEALHLATGRPAYRVVFEFWLKIFGVAFGLGVVSGIVMAFEFGTNWSELSRMSGPIQGPLLSYETFTAFALEASFFGVLLFGRPRVPPWFYLFSTAMVALGTTLSAFWIMVNNSWMQVPVGYAVENGAFVPTDWSKIIFSPVVWVRFPAHAARLLPDRRLLRRRDRRLVPAAAANSTPRRASCCAWASISRPCSCRCSSSSVISTATTSTTISRRSSPRSKARWHDEQPASEVLIALPDAAAETQPLRDQHPGSRQPDRQHEPHVEGSRADRFSAAGPAAGADPVLRLPHHGRLRPASCWSSPGSAPI